jgi:hypothetical protein
MIGGKSRRARQTTFSISMFIGLCIAANYAARRAG